MHEFGVHNDQRLTLIKQHDPINRRHNELALIKLANSDRNLLNKCIDLRNENKYYDCEILFQGRRMKIVYNDMTITEAYL